MHHRKTDLREVPLERPSEPERDGAGSRHSGQVYCVICRSLVSLERCKLNEHGDPVHDHCYFDSVSSSDKPKSQV